MTVLKKKYIKNLDFDKNRARCTMDFQSPISVLVIEDDPITALFYAQVIKNLRALPVLAESAEIARTKLQEIHVPVIIIDLVLPGISGIDYCRELRAEYKPNEPYIIINTSSEDDTLLPEALSAGADDFFVKPVSVKTLETRIQIALSNWQNRVARRKAEETERFLQTVLNSSISGMLICDTQGSIVFANNSINKLLKPNHDSIVSQKITELNVPGFDPIFDKNFFESVTENGIWQTEGQCRRNHQSFSVFVTGSIVKTENNETNFLIQLQDISRQKEKEEHMIYLLNHDSVTGLYNRTSYFNLLDEQIKNHQYHRQKLAVIYIDIDRFKAINESMNHGFGDRLLEAFSKRLQSALPPNIQLARIAGDEFALTLESINDASDCIDVVNTVAKAIKDPFLLQKNEVQITVSIGIVIYPENGLETTELMRNAVLATIRAKDETGNTYSFHSEETNKRLIARLAIENHLRKAVIQNEFSLFLQSIVHGDESIAREEVLLRWDHPHMGNIPPNEFIPIAEESGFILSLGEWVISEAFQIARESQKKLAINISAKQLFSDDFMRFCDNLYRQGNLEHGVFEFEITESIFLHDFDSVKNTLHALKRMGIRIAIDDFGTGYSSFAYLKELPIDVLKIDQIFIREIGRDSKAEAIARTIVTLALTLNIEVVAEGVETLEQFSFLKDLGCQYFQGYLFSRPAHWSL